MENQAENQAEESQDEVQEELALLAGDAKHHAITDDLSWLPQWFLGKKNEAKAARKLVKEQAKRILRQIDNREKALDWHWGAAFREEVTQEIKRSGNRKSVDYLTGRAGFHTSKERITTDVVDTAIAIEYLSVHCPEAVNRSINKSNLNDYVEATGDAIPGVSIQMVSSKENFYPAIEEQPLLAEKQPLLEG